MLQCLRGWHGKSGYSSNGGGKGMAITLLYTSRCGNILSGASCHLLMTIGIYSSGIYIMKI